MTISEALSGPFVAMAAYKQFIVYKLVPSKSRPGKFDKLPCDFRSGRIVSAHEAEYWTDALTANAAALNLGSDYGIGFVFTDNDPFWALDIDNCLLPDGSDWSPVAKVLCQSLAGAAVEISPSMKGLHIFGSGRPPLHGCKNETYGLEFYHTNRFMTLTGNGATGDASTDLSALLPSLVQLYFPPDGTSQGVAQGWTVEPVAEWRGPTDDEELIRRMLRSQSSAAAFGGRASFADLWTANLAALSRCYPDAIRAYDASSADAALSQHLAFWTGKNCERIMSLMQRSALKRDKWDREDYLPRTIIGAVARQFDVLTDKAPEPIQQPNGPLPTATDPEKPRPVPVTGATYLNADMQADLFAGCVYVSAIHRILAPGGRLLRPEQFRVEYGGYTFTIDPANSKTSKDAFEAFTQSQSFRAPRVDLPIFRPDMYPAAIIELNGQRFVNTYWPVEVARKEGNPQPFLNHLAKVLPDPRDRHILLCYMAACVQYKGVKFQWAPLLQGVEGNGKTLFTRCVAEAIGTRYVHFPPAHEISEKFNSWLFDMIFIGVEDIYVPNQKQEIFEILKPMITGDKLAKRAMQTDQVMQSVVANFIFNSNHKDGLRKTQNDRRICTLFCAQQQAHDLKRDGMDGDYFPNLYKWLRVDGYAIVSDLLHTFPIPNEFNPATDCQRAPVTTSTAAAIKAGSGAVEQEIMEAIAQEKPGFCGGWVSSIQLESLLERIGMQRRLTHLKRKELLENMGYIYHPALADGRVNNMVMPDAGKPRLFIHKDNPAVQITTAAEASHAYQHSNNHTRVPFPV